MSKEENKNDNMKKEENAKKQDNNKANNPRQPKK